MYWCIYLYVIIGGIGKTYAAQDKHSSHGERDNKGIKRVYNPLYSRLRIQTIENVIYLISLNLFMTDMLLEKLLAFPHSVNQILPLIFFIYKKILFLCIVFFFRYMLPKFIKKDFVALNFNLLLIPKALPIFFLLWVL